MNKLDKFNVEYTFEGRGKQLNHAQEALSAYSSAFGYKSRTN